MGGDDARAADAAYSTERKLEIGQQGAAPAASNQAEAKMSTAATATKKAKKSSKRERRSAAARARDPRRKAGKWPGAIGLSIDSKVFARFERARRVIGRKEGIKREGGLSRSQAVTRAVELWLEKVGG